MSSREDSWCPISKEPCRDDCAWFGVDYELNEDGVTRNAYCSIAAIAGFFITKEADPEDTFI